MAGRPLQRNPGSGGGLSATHRPRRPRAIFPDAARRRVRILGVDLPERAESAAGRARHGSGRFVDHLAAVGSAAGPENPRPPTLGYPMLRRGPGLAAGAVRVDYPNTR